MACALAMALILGGCGEKAAHDEHGHDHDMHHEEEEAHAHGHEAHGAGEVVFKKQDAEAIGLQTRILGSNQNQRTNPVGPRDRDCSGGYRAGSGYSG